MKYDEIRPSLKTGDMVCFEGRGPFSAIIRMGQKVWEQNHISHVAFVVRFGRGPVRIMESTTLTKVADTKGDIVSGVAARYFSERVKAYGGKIYVRSLLRNPLEYLSEEDFEGWRRPRSGKPYERSKVDLALSVFGNTSLNQDEDSSSYFCSELVAEFYQDHGVISASRPSDSYCPAELASELSDLFGPLVQVTA